MRVAGGAARGAGAVNGYRLRFVRPSALAIERILPATQRTKQGAGGDAFYGQAWALYHFFHHGPEKYRANFKTFETAVYNSYFKVNADAIAHGARMFHEAFGADLTTLMKELNEEGEWHVEGEGLGWRRLSGHKDVDATTGRERLLQILPETTSTFRVYKRDDHLRIVNSHHDAMGEVYTISPKA